jgi:DNA repair exonuclease SbcCD nuclease subunit
MKFLHTADWQIGMEASRCGPAAGAVRTARLRSARQLAGVAGREKADFAVLAGDTFENHGVSRSDVEAVAAILGEFPCPVFVLPGNHDPAAPGSVWEHPAWRERPNVTLLLQPQPAPVPGGVLYPCPLRTRWSADDPTSWIPAGGAPGAIRVGLAHGALAGLPGAASDHPIAPDAAQRRRLDYLALGHYHSTRLYPTPEGRVTMAFSGTHEPTAFGEDASGNVLLVEIDAPAAPPRVQTLHTALLDWRKFQLTVDRTGLLAPLLQQLGELASPSCLLDLRLEGILFSEDQPHLDAIAALAPRFLHARLDTAELLPPVTLDDLPEGPVRETARRLVALCDNPTQGPAARLALQRILRLARGVTK